MYSAAITHLDYILHPSDLPSDNDENHGKPNRASTHVERYINHGQMPLSMPNRDSRP